MNRPEVMKAINMLKEGNQKQLEAYNHLVEAVSMMSYSEVERSDEICSKSRHWNSTCSFGSV